MRDEGTRNGARRESRRRGALDRLCPACVSFIAYELDHGSERRVAGQITSLAPLLWDEGLGDVVRAELERLRGRGTPSRRRRWSSSKPGDRRSTIFRAVVRRLAVELAEGVRRSRIAPSN